MADQLPSKNVTDHWLHAHGVGKGNWQDGQSLVGKWLVFASPEAVDAVWKLIRDATEAGRLGIEAKVSTARPSGYESRRHVICVYTSDFRDKDNVSKVLKGLREIGIQGKCYYKTDQATLNGEYSTEGPFTRKKGRASLYSSDDFETAAP